ncbi:Uncharacterized protein APZ42_009904 [Daphnia magna]|uniref:Uncharacterized protein n=1 Tax=Daphnia magna TaxID=35525 RepID=A0A164DQ00_9CRUS|nr:Uncharacterized protein APZ42_009904 [Daphnia magna]
MGRDRYEYGISAKRTLPMRKRRPRNVNLEIWYVPSTSQTSLNDVFGTSLGRHCVIWEDDGSYTPYHGKTLTITLSSTKRTETTKYLPNYGRKLGIRSCSQMHRKSHDVHLRCGLWNGMGRPLQMLNGN